MLKHGHKLVVGDELEDEGNMFEVGTSIEESS
jgi:hypothetical protein